MCWAREGLWLIYCSVSLAQCLVHKKHLVNFLLGFPGGSGVKNVPANAGDAGSIPGLGRSSGEGNGNPLQYSCLENPWTEEPGRLQSMGLQRVRHDLATKQQQFFC